MADLYIPKRIKVGFQDRDDTFTKRLAYVICYDPKGKLRKEGSWEGWRDKKIAPMELDNLPHGGFILNKGHTRYNWSHFGSSRRTVVRVYNDRGIEFEISPENLVGLLMETTCAKRVIEGDCVYAWAGKDLVLLPVGSEEYQKAKANTERQDMKISAKELKSGCSYQTKKGEDVIYIGRYNWFEWDKDRDKGRVSKKAHIFAHPKQPEDNWRGAVSKFFPKDSVGFLASLNNPDPVENYAELVEEFSNTINADEIKDWEVRPVKDISLETKKARWDHYPPELKKSTYVKRVGDRIDFYVALKVYEQKYDGNKQSFDPKGYRLIKEGSIHTQNAKKVNEHHSYYGNQQYYYGHYNSRDSAPLLSEEELLNKLAEMSDAYMVLASGKKVRIKSLSDYANQTNY